MNNQALPAGSRVRVISYGPFRGLKGTIRKVDTIASLEADEAFCFYLVELEGTHIKEPIWFQYDEVELVVCPALDDERDLEPIRITIQNMDLHDRLLPVRSNGDKNLKMR
ncbi:MAG TPA: KOW motif-containing protein [Ktedonobacteraceae bacterium]